MVWYKSLWLAARSGLGENKKLNFWEKVVMCMGCSPGSFPQPGCPWACSPRAAVWERHCSLWEERKGQKEAAGGKKKKMLWEQNRHERCFKWHICIDHKGTLKCSIKYWSSHHTVHNPCLLQKRHAGRYRSGRSILWCAGTRGERESPPAPERAQGRQSRPLRPRAVPVPGKAVPCSVGCPGSAGVSPGPARGEAARAVPPRGDAPRRAVPQGCGKGSVQPRGAAGCRGSPARPWWPCPRLGPPVPCPRGAGATRGHWNTTGAMERRAPERNRGSRGATAFPLIRALDKIPEQRINARKCSSRRVPTVPYRGWNKTGRVNTRQWKALCAGSSWDEMRLFPCSCFVRLK